MQAVVHFVPTRKPLVALTFDDGPTAGVTDRIVGLLSKHGAKGTFFMVGKSVRANKTIISDVVSAGNAVGIHGYSHLKGMKEWHREEILYDFRMARDELAQATNSMVLLARPPFGNVSEGILSVIAQLGMK